MGTLLILQPLSLLILLLQPFPFGFLMLRKYLDFTPEREEEFEDYLAEVYSTGPTKPPTRESFKKHVIINDTGDILHDMYYCAYNIMMKRVHNRFRCKKEHFFLHVEYEELEEMCRQIFVACKNGVKRCHQSQKLIEGVYCNLASGTRMPNCYYISSYRKGYVLITCRWQDDIHKIIPAHVNSIVEIPDKE